MTRRIFLWGRCVSRKLKIAAPIPSPAARNARPRGAAKRPGGFAPGLTRIASVAVLLAVGCSRDANPADPVTRALRPYVTPPGAPQHRVLVVGWDGATFNMIDPLLDEGRLPNLQKLINDGAQYELESTVIPVSSEAWVSAVTGVGPGKSGVFGFFGRAPGSYDLQLVSSRSRQFPAIWNILGHYGRRTHVVSVPITYPPENVLGVNFGCMLAPFDADYAYPPGLADTLRGLGFQPDLDAWREARPITTERIEQDHAVRTDILCSLAQHSAWDLLITNYKSLDVLSHRLYSGQTFGPIADHYVRLDDALGRLRAAAGPQTDVIVLSDHGFGLYTHQLSVHALLAEIGVLKLKADGGPLAADGSRPMSETFAALQAEDLRRIDMSQTTAYCDSTEGHFAALRLNLRGREPQGIVSPEERGAAAAELIDRLLAARLPGSDQPVFVRAWRMEELYPGPAAADLPEILLEADRRFLCRPYYVRPTAAKLPVPFPEHERTGVLLAAGPSIRRGGRREQASILDVTPTLLQLLGVPVWREMDGKVIGSLFREPPAIAWVDGATLGVRSAWVGGDIEPGTSSEDVMRRLQALGYVQTRTDDDEGNAQSRPSGGNP